MQLRFTPKGLLALVCVTLIGGFANAASISKITGDKIFVDFTEGEDIAPGGRFLVVIGGKKKAVIEILKVKGQKALAKLLKGKADVGGELTALAAGGKKSSSAGAPPVERKSRRSTSGVFSDMTYGVLVGLDSATQEVTASGSSISMAGSGFSLKGYGDLPIAGSLGMTGRLGATQFSVKGSSGGVDYKTDILYATADLLLRYNFGDDGFVPYGTGGLGLHFPISKSSNVLDTQRVSATTVFFLGGGFHYTMGETSFFTLGAEYGMFPPSNDVKTSMISLRAGLGWAL
mgnify:CR=1 FL=1